MTQTSLPGLPRRRALALALLAAIAAGAAFAESGTVLKDTPLRSEPLASASEVGKLKARETVEITARKGAWAGVKRMVRGLPAMPDSGPARVAVAAVTVSGRVASGVPSTPSTKRIS